MSLAIIDDGPMYQAVGQNLCAPVEETGTVKELYDNARMVGAKSTGIGFIATGLAYNKDVFAKNGWQAPTSWNDLADPKYKGKVVIPPITNGYGLLTLVMQARINGGGEDKIDPGFDTMIKKVAPKFAPPSSSSIATSSLSTYKHTSKRNSSWNPITSDRTARA